jgi:type II secretory pathway component PulF
MTYARANRSVSGAAVLLGVAVLLWAAVAAVLVTAVPRYERVFRDEGRRLPGPTEWTISAGHWAGNYWYVLPLFGLLVLPVIVLLSVGLWRRAPRSLPAWIWFGLLLGAPSLLLLAIWGALLMP